MRTMIFDVKNFVVFNAPVVASWGETFVVALTAIVNHI